MDRLTKLLDEMIHSPLHNYIIPGLSSYLIGGRDYGKVRMFHNTREQGQTIVPHSHRFSFTCLVLEGKVHNYIWTESQTEGDFYCKQLVGYKGNPGQYIKNTPTPTAKWKFKQNTYGQGHFYSMEADEIHSIWFSKGAKVLFFEGRQVTDDSYALLPVVDGKIIDTLKTEDWMFIRGE